MHMTLVELRIGSVCVCSAKFLVEEDEEGVKKELREAFRIYDKEGNGYIPTSALKVCFKVPLTIQCSDRPCQHCLTD